MAADSAVMVIDGSKGVEAQTRKLFKVCVMRHIPIFTFINKLDREAKDTFELLDDIEKELGIATCPVNWPIGSGKEFKGVYDRAKREVELFSDTKKGTAMGEVKMIPIDAPETEELIGADAKDILADEIELLDGAAAEFDQELVDMDSFHRYFRIRSYQLWCRDFPEAFPEDDNLSASKKIRSWRDRSNDRKRLLSICI